MASKPCTGLQPKLLRLPAHAVEKLRYHHGSKQLCGPLIHLLASVVRWRNIAGLSHPLPKQQSEADRWQCWSALQMGLAVVMAKCFSHCCLTVLMTAGVLLDWELLALRLAQMCKSGMMSRDSVITSITNSYASDAVQVPDCYVEEWGWQAGCMVNRLAGGAFVCSHLHSLQSHWLSKWHSCAEC